nr:flagellar motor control protein ZomB [Tomitella biformata]
MSSKDRPLGLARRLLTPAGLTALSITVAAALFAWGAWQRRWIADDGLIVLRTVRNLLAGNGPVFNKGERVEVNTSAAWTYVVWFFSWLSRAQMEYVVLGITLVLSVLAIVFVMLGSGRLHRHRAQAAGVSGMILLPAGVFGYMALPPARDFATSGLETSLVICWIGLVFWLLMRWATTATPSRAQILTLGFIAGLCWLVRPETVLVAAPILLLLFCVKQGWRSRVLLVVVSGLLPVGYQIWRMGYYGLPYPNTAVAKDATEAKWGVGLTYLGDLAGPYRMWVPLALLLLIAAVVLVNRATAAPAAAYRPPNSLRARWAKFQRWLHSPAAAVTLILAVGLIWLIYEIRVGGDFMHGRVLLPVVFILMAPLAMIPVRLPTREQWRSTVVRPTGPRAAAVVTLAAWIGMIAWALAVVNTGPEARAGTLTRNGIVDERGFYSVQTGNAHPLTAADYLAFPRIGSMVDAIRRTPEGGLLVQAAAMDDWVAIPPLGPIPEGGAGHTIYFINLGMPSMNTDLDTKVYDMVGLAYPLAAHSPRIEHARIGHDKSLPVDWMIAEKGFVPEHDWGLPGWIDEDWVAEAKVALTCEDTRMLLESYQGELTVRKFLSNIRNAWSYGQYEIDRVPEYEIQRCDLVAPALQNPR